MTGEDAAIWVGKLNTLPMANARAVVNPFGLAWIELSIGEFYVTLTTVREAGLAFTIISSVGRWNGYIFR